MKELPTLPEDEPVLIAPGLKMHFRRIPSLEYEEAARRKGEPLSFLMGSRGISSWEEPRHRVVIPQPFYLGTFPVTQGEFACFRPKHRSHFHGKPKHPVEDVSWDDAQDFLRWVNESGKLRDGLVARLPSEAEWEYACRAGTETEYYNGDGEGALREVGWFGEDSGTGGTHAVGSKFENHPWGLHDMHGNVLEWCEDEWAELAYGRRRDGWMARAWTKADVGRDAEGDEARPIRVMRGGSWFVPAGGCRAAFRIWRHPGNRWNQGFRVFLALPGPAEPVKPGKRAEAVREREGGTTDRATGRPEPGAVRGGKRLKKGATQ